MGPSARARRTHRPSARRDLLASAVRGLQDFIVVALGRPGAGLVDLDGAGAEVDQGLLGDRAPTAVQRVIADAKLAAHGLDRGFQRRRRRAVGCEPRRPVELLVVVEAALAEPGGQLVPGRAWDARRADQLWDCDCRATGVGGLKDVAQPSPPPPAHLERMVQALAIEVADLSDVLQKRADGFGCVIVQGIVEHDGRPVQVRRGHKAGPVDHLVLDAPVLDACQRFLVLEV